MDIGAAQDLLGRVGQLTRIDLQLQPGTDRSAFRKRCTPCPAGPRKPRWPSPAMRRSAWQPVARLPRQPDGAGAGGAVHRGVSGVLGAGAQRGAARAAVCAAGRAGRHAAPAAGLVLLESALLGVVGSLAGWRWARPWPALALQLLGGDLGGGYFAGVQPRLQWSPRRPALRLLGAAAAVAGGWWPARAAQALPPAQTLKGLGSASGRRAGLAWYG
jgi:putative ABC transport system permease protein